MHRRIFDVTFALGLICWTSHASSQVAHSDRPKSAASEESDATVLMPMRFGARGDGSSDDTAALNSTYAAAREKHENVFLRGRLYNVSGQIDARGVSTIGEGATLVFRLNSARSPNAFVWGGSDTVVTGVRFDLSNSGAATMQGILDPVDDAADQRFYQNRIVCHTTDQSSVKSNIYGLWITGSGLSGLDVEDNQFDTCTYGVQVNIQNGMQQDVRTNPLGKPSANIHISNNTFTDATLGVNTPHIEVSDVVIEGNVIAPRKLRLDLPLNVAHVTRLAIIGNTVTSNASSANGTLHVEDASGAVTITGNVVVAQGKNNGIQVGVDPSVSHDLPPTNRVTITGNHVTGPGADIVDSVGILLPDKNTIDTTVSGNYIADFAQCVTASGQSNISGNTLVRCPTPVKSPKSQVFTNMVKE
ncbi:hypothetical protein AAHK20_27975 [Trinickia sp. YCB016]